jgi:hypothetical protein
MSSLAGSSNRATTKLSSSQCTDIASDEWLDVVAVGIRWRSMPVSRDASVDDLGYVYAVVSSIIAIATYPI